MEQKSKHPFVENLKKWGRTDFQAERQKAADEVQFWEGLLESDDPLARRQANGNIESARGRLRQLEEHLAGGTNG
jgi:hypothetical protein